MLPVLIPLGTRRPLQVLWMRSIRSPGEVKHRLLQSGLPWTTGMTGRNEITACDSWLNQRLPSSANMLLLIYPSETLSAISLYLFSVSKLIIFFKCLADNPLTLKSHCCYDVTRQRRIKSGQEKINIAVILWCPWIEGFTDNKLLWLRYYHYYFFLLLSYGKMWEKLSSNVTAVIPWYSSHCWSHVFFLLV